MLPPSQGLNQASFCLVFPWRPLRTDFVTCVLWSTHETDFAQVHVTECQQGPHVAQRSSHFLYSCMEPPLPLPPCHGHPKPLTVTEHRIFTDAIK